MKDVDKSTTHFIVKRPFRLKYTLQKCKVNDIIVVPFKDKEGTISVKVLDVYDNDEYKVVMI